MKNFCIFADAVGYIEENLCGDLKQEEIAAACCCSLSALQKVWRYCTHTSLKEYISKRRLTRCAEEIMNTDLTLTEIAMKYQYNSPEVFTRAFRKFWGISPSRFKSERHSTGFFPRILPVEQVQGGKHMGRRVDISELYDELQKKREGYVLCYDVVGLDETNKNLGRKVGDAVILEAFRRIDEAAGSEMIVFRIGGDEFAVVTGLSEKEAVEAEAKKVLSQNGKTILCEEKEIPVSLRAGAIRLGDDKKHSIRYNELFDHLRYVTDHAQNLGKVDFCSE